MKRHIKFSIIISALISPTMAYAASETIVDDSLATSQTPQKAEAKTTLPNDVEKSSPLACKGSLNYVPWPAISAENYTAFSVENGNLKKIISAWPTTTAEVSKLLPNISTQVSILTGEAEVDVGIFGKSKWRSVEYAIDFMKYRSEPIQDTSGKAYSWGRVGAGMRLIVKVRTREASISGNLMAIAASAKAGDTTGSISADIIGLDAKDVTLSVPFTTDLSDQSIQKIIEALAVIKSKFGDATTNIKPQLIARIDCDDPTDIDHKNKNIASK